MLERDIEKYLVKRIKAIGGQCYKFVSPQNRGVSDRIVLLPNRVVFVEVKTEKGKMTMLQQLFANIVTGYGLEYHCIWGKEDVDKLFGETK